jgi:hypothetical protein
VTRALRLLRMVRCAGLSQPWMLGGDVCSVVCAFTHALGLNGCTVCRRVCGRQPLCDGRGHGVCERDECAVARGSSYPLVGSRLCERLRRVAQMTTERHDSRPCLWDPPTWNALLRLYARRRSARRSRARAEEGGRERETPSGIAARRSGHWAATTADARRSRLLLCSAKGNCARAAW